MEKLQYGEEGNEDIIEGRDGRGVGGGEPMKGKVVKENV